MDFKGVPPPPSALANTGAPPYRGIPAQVLTPTAGAITRNLVSEL